VSRRYRCYGLPHERGSGGKDNGGILRRVDTGLSSVTMRHSDCMANPTVTKHRCSIEQCGSYGIIFVSGYCMRNFLRPSLTFIVTPAGRRSYPTFEALGSANQKFAACEYASASF